MIFSETKIYLHSQSNFYGVITLYHTIFCPIIFLLTSTDNLKTSYLEHIIYSPFCVSVRRVYFPLHLLSTRSNFQDGIHIKFSSFQYVSPVTFVQLIFLKIYFLSLYRGFISQQVTGENQNYDQLFTWHTPSTRAHRHTGTCAKLSHFQDFSPQTSLHRLFPIIYVSNFYKEVLLCNLDNWNYAHFYTHTTWNFKSSNET